MKKIMHIFTKSLLIKLLLLLTVGGVYVLYQQHGVIADIQEQLKLTAEQVKQTAEQHNVNVFTAMVSSDGNSGSSEILQSDLAKKGYYGSVIQLGGLGSHITQTSAHSYGDAEGSYDDLFPPDDWVLTNFTRGQAMWTNCRNGYKLKSCTLSNDKKPYIEPAFGCFLEPAKLREDVSIECVAISEDATMK